MFRVRGASRSPSGCQRASSSSGWKLNRRSVLSGAIPHTFVIPSSTALTTYVAVFKEEEFDGVVQRGRSKRAF